MLSKVYNADLSSIFVMVSADLYLYLNFVRVRYNSKLYMFLLKCQNVHCI